jgi:hypothetical protein
MLFLGGSMTSSSSDLLWEVPLVMEESSRAKETAIVVSTKAPIRLRLLEKIYTWSRELSEQQSAYHIWITVDETKANGTESRVRDYFSKHLTELPLPGIFVVSENKILETYPKLTSYIYNEPERNSNNKTGLCCKRPIMWQMFIPSLALFLSSTQYKYAWRIEDDIEAVGKDSLLQILRRWDLELVEDVDFVGQPTHIKPAKTNAFVNKRHTPGFDEIVTAMKKTKGSPAWTCYSDAIQRHSLRLGKYLYDRVAENIFQFGECMVQPIIWEAGFSIVQLDSLLKEPLGVSGLKRLTGTGQKISREKALERFFKGSNASFVYHQEPEKAGPSRPGTKQKLRVK